VRVDDGVYGTPVLVTDFEVDALRVSQRYCSSLDFVMYRCIVPRVVRDMLCHVCGERN
jgi:hypothetical protein